MKKRFNTKETAERHLEYRRKCAIKRIEKKNDIVLGDNSFVMYHDNEDKWSVMLMILTKQMRDEITKRWEEAGLLEGLDGDVKENCAQLFEAQKLFKIKEDDGMDS